MVSPPFFIPNVSLLTERPSSTCKARHIRRDENKPVCSNCKRLNLECEASEFISQSKIDGLNTRAPRRTSVRHAGVSIDTAQPSDGFPGSEPFLSGSSLPSELLSLTQEHVYLLNTYRSGVATWMDLLDFNNTFQTDVTRVGTTCPLLLRCICAFAAKHLSLQTSGAAWDPIASRYYVETLSLLIKEIDQVETPTANSLTAAILLSSYEIMAALSTPHRSHYKGALDLIRARRVSASSLGLDGKNFRVYVRHEVVVALANEMPLQLDPNEWRMPPLKQCPAEDQLAMHVMFLAGRAINVVFGDDPSGDRQRLIHELNSWHNTAPVTMRGTRYGDVDEDGLQRVFFAVPAAAAAMLWYHLKCIVLYAERCDYGPTNPIATNDHIGAILSIATSDLSNCVRCFAITPIFYAGKHSSDITKTFTAWSLLMDIEQDLGYGTSAMVRALKEIVQRRNV